VSVKGLRQPHITHTHRGGERGREREREREREEGEAEGETERKRVETYRKPPLIVFQ
jgi:hypothetical protein